MLHVACCMLHAACYMLHVACCMLHAACCMLHVACCSVIWGNSFGCMFWRCCPIHVGVWFGTESAKTARATIPADFVPMFVAAARTAGGGVEWKGRARVEARAKQSRQWFDCAPVARNRAKGPKCGTLQSNSCWCVIWGDSCGCMFWALHGV